MPNLATLVSAAAGSGRFIPNKPTLEYAGSGTSNNGNFTIGGYDPTFIYTATNGTVAGNVLTVTNPNGSATLTARAPKGLAASSTITASRLAAAQSSYYVQTAPVQCYNSGSCASQCGGCGTFYEPGNPTWNGVGGFWSCCDQGYTVFFYIDYVGSGYTWGGSNYTNGSGEWWRIV